MTFSRFKSATPFRMWIPVVGLSIASVFASASAYSQTSRLGPHDRMAELQAQISAAKGDPNADARQLAANRAELAQISASMGGDLPCATGRAVAGTFAVRAPAPSPTGCAPTTTSFPNTTAVAIPTGPAVVTSTITVTGAAAYLWDVDLTTFITHTFNADLDITLQSPAGTVVTLTSDNGGGNDNVFNGTVWDDDANPLGQVPYTSNNGVVTDHVYADLTLASPLVPEESLAAFVGENPNGVWTITISDDLAANGGSLDQWSLNLTTFAAAPTMAPVQSFNQTTPVAILDNAVVSSPLLVAGLANPICKAVLRTNITHTWNSDLFMTLTSPSGTVVTLSTANGGSAANVFNGTVWDDDANPAGQVPYTTNDGVTTDHVYANNVTATPLVVEESMGAFMGEVGNGTWTLRVSDQAGLDVGSIDSWGLDFVTCACAPALPPPADNNPRKQGGYIGNGAANCRGALAADQAMLVAEQDGLSNPAASTALVVCSQAADEFARSSGNGTPNVGGIASFTIVFLNRGAAMANVSCTGTAGRAGGPQFSSNKSVMVAPGSRSPINWTAIADNAGVPFQRPTNIVCTIPTDIQINETYNRYFREVGDFVPVP